MLKLCYLLLGDPSTLGKLLLCQTCCVTRKPNLKPGGQYGVDVDLPKVLPTTNPSLDFHAPKLT